jgi:molybdopterin converting factor small subunit
MQIRILLFAGIRDVAGRDAVEIAAEANPTVAQLTELVASQIPDAADLIRVSRLAVDGHYVAPDQPIERADHEFALIPPVSGG